MGGRDLIGAVWCCLCKKRGEDEEVVFLPSRVDVAAATGDENVFQPAPRTRWVGGSVGPMCLGLDMTNLQI